MATWKYGSIGAYFGTNVSDNYISYIEDWGSSNLNAQIYLLVDSSYRVGSSVTVRMRFRINSSYTGTYTDTFVLLLASLPVGAGVPEGTDAVQASPTVQISQKSSDPPIDITFTADAIPASFVGKQIVFMLFHQDDSGSFTSAGGGLISSVVVTEAPVITPLSAPTNLNLTTEDTTVTLSWDSVSNASGYQAEYKASSDSSYTVIENVSGTTATFTGSESTLYTIRVKALGTGDYSDSSYTSTTITLRPFPTKTLNLSQLFNNTVVNLCKPLTIWQKICNVIRSNAGKSSTDTVTTLTAPDKEYGGSILAPNGCIYCTPNGANNVLKIDTTTDTITTVGSVSASYAGSVLADNGIIYVAPNGTTTILKVDTSTDTVSTIAIGSSFACRSGVRAANGCIYWVPRTGTSILKLDPTTDTVTTFGSLGSTSNKFASCVLAPNGCIYAIPYTYTSVVKIDPKTDTVTTFGSLSGSAKWQHGILAPNGYIYGVPQASRAVLKIDPNTDTVTTFGSLASGSDKWWSGVLAPNGCIYGIPKASANILKIDTKTDTATTFGSLGTSGNKYTGAKLAPNGCLYTVSHSSQYVRKIDPTDDSITDIDTINTGSNMYFDAAIAPNGCIYYSPMGKSNVIKIDTGASSLNKFNLKMLNSQFFRDTHI